MHPIDDILLAPYSLFLRLRHFMYDHNIMKSGKTDVPSICIGNITVGGTGKTPHTEMLLRILSELPQYKGWQLAVLSRGYKRRTQGFLEVTADGSAKQFGDEPLQIKKKFPDVIVAVDRDRLHGCQVLCADIVSARTETEPKPQPEPQPDTPWSDDLFAEVNRQDDSPKSKTGSADLIILEDAFQHRRIRANVSIVLVDYNRPIFNDHLLPIGHLRDLPSRLQKADIVIVSKCPSYLSREDAEAFASNLKYKGNLFFTSMFYDSYKPVFPEGDMRYTHAKRLILFTGIANDEHLLNSLSLKFRVVKHFAFGDHHKYIPNDIAMIRRSAEWFATAVIMTTEKDAQRILDCSYIPKIIKERLFYVPVKMDFLSPGESDRFVSTLQSYL